MGSVVRASLISHFKISFPSSVTGDGFQRGHLKDGFDKVNVIDGHLRERSIVLYRQVEK